MKELIERLKQLREQEEIQQSYVQNRQSMLEETIEYDLLENAKSDLMDIQNSVKLLDEQIREAALLEYAQTGNKKPVNGVSVVINKKLHYRAERAIRWCIHNAFELVKLDTRAFEKHARAVSDTVPIEFVEVTEEPSVRIAREL